MADYWTEVSFILELPKPVMDFVTGILEVASELEEGTEYTDEQIEELQSREHLQAVMADPDAIELAHNILGYGIDMQPEDAEEPGYVAAWCHHDESFDVDGMIEAVHYALKKFDCDDIVCFEWSGSCSKPRTDAFGGGAVVISKEEVKATTTYDWMRQAAEDIEAARKETAKK